MSRIVVPGELLEGKPLHIENSIIDEEKTFSAVLGIFDEEKHTLVALEGLWYPRRGDMVIGVIDEARLNSYSVELNAPYKGILVSKYIESRLEEGDVVEAEVREIDETKTVVLARAKKLFGGKIIDVKPSKVPRIIGKGNTMISQILEGTKSIIRVGMNGRIWIKGGDVALATQAILKIEEEAHTSGLTDRIKAMMPPGTAATQQQPM